MAGKPQKNLAYSVLLDFYGPALTEKQRAILTEYYDEDLSLAEIAENFGITRQGVRCCNSGLFNPVPRIRTDTDEMLKIIERLDAQEEPDGV